MLSCVFEIFCLFTFFLVNYLFVLAFKKLKNAVDQDNQLNYVNHGFALYIDFFFEVCR